MRVNGRWVAVQDQEMDLCLAVDQAAGTVRLRGPRFVHGRERPAKRIRMGTRARSLTLNQQCISCGYDTLLRLGQRTTEGGEVSHLSSRPGRELPVKM